MIKLKNTIEIGRGERTILALDPSSTRTGIAVMGFDNELIDQFALVPKPDDTSDVRILIQCRDLRQALDQGVFKPEVIVIEGTSGKINKKRNKGQGAGMAIYGIAVGAIWMTCNWWAADNKSDCPVEIVLENDWTRGVTKKQRAINMSLIYPQYKPYLDPGLDIGDAIGLGLWWLENNKLLKHNGNTTETQRTA